MKVPREKWRWLPIFLGVCLVLCGGHALGQTGGEESSRIEVSGPTVIAFCEPISDAQMEKDPDLADVLGDFQLYASRARAPLHDAGVRLEELYVHAFSVIVAGRRTEFRPRVGVGYYFVAPGKKPRIEYGVMTDPDIVQVAREYFAIPIK